jgi:hypothetical protein
MYIIGINALDHLGCQDPAAVTCQGSYLASRVECNTTTFINVHMGFLLANQFVARAGVADDGGLVRHCPTRAKKSGFHSEKAGHPAFQQIDGRIFPENIVSY